MEYRQQPWDFDTKTRKPLSAVEVNYWTHTLNKILKVGTEFEFNLPEAQGLCDGRSNSCPCQHLFDKDCWKECANTAYCVRINEGKACFANSCSEFVPFCNNCGDYTRDCDSCDLRSDPKKSPKIIRSTVREALNPTMSYGRMGDTGCHKVIQDGSLRGDKGMEVVTIGRRVDFWEFYKMTKKIIDLALAHHGYVDELCSIHMHVLTSYYGKVREDARQQPLENDASVPADINELERPMPGIIAANFHQLCRRYQNALTWMSMGLDNKNHLTRWEKYRMSILEVSPMAQGFKQLVSHVANLGYKHKYGWVNYMFTRMVDDDTIDRFHVEMRVLDCLMSPTIVSAFACLFQAMVIRAVELSRYGVVQAGDTQWLAEANTVKRTLMNKSDGWPDKGDPVGRKANNEGLTDYAQLLELESMDLLSQVKHILSQTGPAYDILSKLAGQPVAFMRCDGASWEEIEEHFHVEEADVEDAEIAEAIDKFVCLRLINNCGSMAEWIEKASLSLSKENEMDKEVFARVQSYVESKQVDGQLVWSSPLGTAMKIQ